MDNKYIKIIKGTPLFQGMSDEEIAQFLRPDGSGIKSFRKESYIFHAGDKTAYFGILLEGKALIERDELWGGRSIIAPLEAGQLFGEVYACTGEPLGVSVCANEQCTVLFLSPESIIKESSTLTARLLKITAMKNLRLNEKIQVITPGLSESVLWFIFLRLQRKADRTLSRQISTVNSLQIFSALTAVRCQQSLEKCTVRG